MQEICSYLVRIYRRNGDMVAGLVEQVRSGRTAPFATLAELSALLAGRRSFGRRRSGRVGATVDAQPTVNHSHPRGKP